MKKLLSIVLVMILVLTGVSYVFGEEAITEVTYDLSDFDSISVDRAFTVQVSQGDTYSVIIKADASIQDKLDVRKEGSVLILSVKDNESINNKKYEAILVVPDISRIESKGASTISGELALDDLTIDADTATTITLSGSVNTLDIKAKQASQVNTKSMHSVDATVVANQASTVYVTVKHQVTAEATNASTIHVYGSGTINGTADFTSDVKAYDEAVVETPVEEKPEEDVEMPDDQWFDFNPFQGNESFDEMMRDCDEIYVSAEKDFQVALEAFEKAVEEYEAAMRLYEEKMEALFNN